ncbi:MAG: hypothetical protein HYZ51_01090 [Candidatus Doudnabacteria bacterium]|nr:hypothetical protein [Candidatus Doudnabacteria bacterium]
MELESQVAKIQLGEQTSGKSFIYLAAEKLPRGQGESFIIAEILENSQAERAACEQITLSIRAALMRAYKKNGEDQDFELAVAQVNQELGKLASLGQIHWIDKLNCIIGIKIGNVFSIATAGKVAAFLLRGQELSDLECSSEKPHPLKTFENFASGKLRLGDILILSTNQLFNHISVDKLKLLLLHNDFLRASGQIVGLLKHNASPEVSFGTILAQQMEIGTLKEGDIDLEEYVESKALSGPTFFSRVKHFFAVLLSPGKFTRLKTAEHLPTPSKLKTLFSQTKTLVYRLARLAGGFGRDSLAPSKIKQFSPQKKFLFFSICLLLLAIILQITTAVYVKNQREARNKILAAVRQAQKNLNDSDTALLYKDEPSAKDYYLKFISSLNALNGLSKEQQSLVNELKKQGDELKSRLEKTVEAPSQNLGSLAMGASLIRLPEYLAVQSGQQIISFNRATNSIRDDALKLNAKIELSEPLDKSKAIVYDGESLKVWDYTTGSTGMKLISNVPAKENAVGLKLYPTNSRVYMLDKAKNQIINFQVSAGQLGKPQIPVNLKTDDAKNAVDLAIDGNIYVLTRDNIKKYYLGSPDDFKLGLLEPLNTPKKIFTQTNFKYIYVLDSGNKRIVVLNKQAGLVYTLINQSFTDLTDFEVDEKAKTIFVLNGSSLLKVVLP